MFVRNLCNWRVSKILVMIRNCAIFYERKCLSREISTWDLPLMYKQFLILPLKQFRTFPETKKSFFPLHALKNSANSFMPFSLSPHTHRCLLATYCTNTAFFLLFDFNQFNWQFVPSTIQFSLSRRIERKSKRQERKNFKVFFNWWQSFIWNSTKE